MSIQRRLRREIPADTAAVGQQILRLSNPYRQLGDRFTELFPQEDLLESMYQDTGRGAIPPLLLALITVFQMWEKIPDRLAADQVVTRLDWKYALHLPLVDLGFHFTDLTAFRARLLAHQQERVFFDQLITRLKGLGLLASHGTMRSDSSHILAVVERLGRLELVTESLRLALEAVRSLVPAWLEATIPPAFQDAYRERQSAYGLDDSEVNRRLVKSGQDAVWFLAQWDRALPVAPDQVPPAVETLRTVVAQQFTSADGSTPRTKRPSGREVIDSPHEPEARAHIKRSTFWTGYKMQVTETCDAGKPRLIADIDVTAAHDNDSPQLPLIQERLVAQGTAPGMHLVDQGYMSGENLVTSQARGIILLGEPLADTQHAPGFQQCDFVIDEVAQQATCPAGQTSSYWHAQEGPAPAGGRAAVDIRFAAGVCRSCAFFGLCTTSPRGRSLALHPYRQALAERRREAQTAAFRAQMRQRAGVEATISELVRGYRLRFARYRGQTKVRLQAYFTAAAVNLRRGLRWWAEPRAESTEIIPA